MTFTFVNLMTKTCNCRKWQVIGLPCVHAAAAITTLRHDLESFVDEVYNIEKYRIAYALPIQPFRDKLF